MRERRTPRPEHLILLSTMIAGSYPVLVHASVKVLPPFFFAAAGTLLASLLHAAYALYHGEWGVRLPRVRIAQLTVVALCIVVVPSLTFFIGTRWTSGINSALLGQVEIPLTFLVCGLVFGERIVRRQLIGALVGLIGALFILFHRSFSLNPGDLLIMLGACFYPFGNVAARRALQDLSPRVVLCVRSLLGGSILLLISLSLEGNPIALLQANLGELWRVLFYGVVILFLEKLLWYHGLRGLTVSKGISLLAAVPAFGLLFAVVFLREIPTVLQSAGFLLTLAGIGILTRAPRSAPEPL